MSNTDLLGFRIRSLWQQIKRLMNRHLTENDGYGLTGMQFAIVSYIARESAERDIFQKDLEQKFDIRKSTVSGILNTMERDGLLLRETVPYDARLRKMMLTEKALQAKENTEQVIDSVENQLSKGLSQEEIVTFLEILEKIAKNAEG
ncbi:MarR family winged helix-turn-helix transcriptional regulator [Trichococcus ilyis]|uniref:DNA-binding transcriptional regulator, MarR family n=1 Tax=Trichococcus ilyis TaxID=640938 RepID=A0A143Z6Z8_9LACT|nr:MarR family winged helix-turn-helix transcriptional regulator [Trichococcus ilyis]CZR08812.1 helix turn helix multiple antibiotic resistance protein [Trichococcus ilyis]SEJ80708.1 DNA-binding transcriptional regulator, MarR family [Trichococcus ilyis]